MISQGSSKALHIFGNYASPSSWLSLSLMVVLKPILKRSCLKWGPFEVALAAAAGARYPSQDALWESWPAVLAPFVWTCSRHDVGLHSTFHFSHQWQDDKPLHWIWQTTFKVCMKKKFVPENYMYILHIQNEWFAVLNCHYKKRTSYWSMHGK